MSATEPLQPRPESDAWEACPRGVLTDLAGSLKQRSQRARRTQTLNRAAAVLTLLLTLGLGAYGASLYLAGEPAMPPVTCREVMDHLPQYVQGQLEPQLEVQFARHLEHCPACHAAHDRYVAEHERHASISKENNRMLAVVR